MKTLVLGALASVVISGVGFAQNREGAWRSQIAVALHLPERLPALAPETHGWFAPEPGVIAERISYATLHGMRVPAIVYYPENRTGRMPALIVVNGHGGDKYSWYAHYTGVLYARAGACVLTYDPLGEGERSPTRLSRTQGHDRLERIPAVGSYMGGQMVSDVRQAVSYLAQRPDVDPKRMAAFGYSLGSFVVALTGAVETRLHACVLVGGGNLDEVGGYWDRALPLCQGWPYQAVRGLGDRGAVIYALHAARGPTLVFNGTEDEVVAITSSGEPFFRHLRERTIALRGSADNVFEYGFERGASHRPYFVTRPVALWLERKLDFPRWTAADIEAMPVTRIGDWAKERNAAISPNYVSDIREGGTLALGANLPVPMRKQLCVFTPEEWERNKAALTIDQWEKRIHGLLSRLDRPKVILVANGRLASTVILAANAGAQERTAAMELVSSIEKRTGAKLPIAAAREVVAGARILVGASACPRDLQFELRALPADSYLLRVTYDNSVILAGQSELATRRAVDDFVQRYLSGPTSPNGTLTLEPVRVVVNPTAPSSPFSGTNP